METEGYAIGSIADLISGKTTPSKPKVIQKAFEKQSVQTTVQSRKVKKIKESSESKSEKRLSLKQEETETTKLTPRGKRKRSEDKDVIETEETEPPKKKNKNNSNMNDKDVKTKQKTEEEKLFGDRTLFVGNVPIQMSKSKLTKLFSKFGNVESVRIRGVPVADVRVPKKVAYVKKEFHPKRTSVLCYVRFSTSEEAQKALVLNGQIIKDHHLRVKLCNEDSNPDSSKALFIGNVSFHAEEDDVWKLFEPCGKIESVRLVRDAKTGIGKGFGYVNFESSDSVELAMQMEKFTLKGRDLRVSVYKTNAKKGKRDNFQKKVKKEKIKKEKKSVSIKEQSDDTVKEKKKITTLEKQDFAGVKVTEKKKKKKLNKGLLEKKKLVKKLMSKTKS